MSSVLSNYGGNTALTAMLGQSGLYLALHLTQPTEVDPAATEVAGGGYIRRPIHFAAPSARSIVSSNDQTFAGMPACTVDYLVVWTAISGGSWIFYIDISSNPLIVPTSSHVLVAAGDIALSN
jgi:hypothetical protein